MKIRKVNQTVATGAQIVNGFSDSTTNGYSCDYINKNVQAMKLYASPVQGELFITTNGSDPQPSFSITYGGQAHAYLLNASSMLCGDWLDSDFNTDDFYIDVDHNDKYSIKVINRTPLQPDYYIPDLEADTESALRAKRIYRNSSYVMELDTD